MSLKEKDIIRRAENWKKYREAKEKINAEAKRESIKRYWGNIYRVARNAYLDSILIAEKGDDVCINGCYCRQRFKSNTEYQGQTSQASFTMCDGKVGDKCPYPKKVNNFNHNSMVHLGLKNNQILMDIEKAGYK